MTYPIRTNPVKKNRHWVRVREEDLTQAEASAVYWLNYYYFEKGYSRITMKDLSELTGSSYQGRYSNMIRRLEALGYIAKEKEGRKTYLIPLKVATEPPSSVAKWKFKKGKPAKSCCESSSE